MKQDEEIITSSLRFRRIKLQRKKIDEHLWTLVVLCRYHSLEDFSEPKTPITVISKRLSLPQTTVYTLLNRFHERGFQFKFPKRGRPCPAMPEHLQKALRAPELLQEWASFPLWKRAGMIEKRFNFKISVTRLRNFYLRASVKFRAASTVYRKAITNHD